MLIRAKYMCVRVEFYDYNILITIRDPACTFSLHTYVVGMDLVRDPACTFSWHTYVVEMDLVTRLVLSVGTRM